MSSSAFVTCWSDPINCLKYAFSDPGGSDVLSTVSPTDTSLGMNEGTKNGIAQAQIRSFGVDPNTGALIAPQYAASAELNGYDPTNPQAFIAMITAQTGNQFDKQLADNLASSQLFPSLPDLPGLPSLGDPSNWLAIGLIVVLAFLLIEAVK